MAPADPRQFVDAVNEKGIGQQQKKSSRDIHRTLGPGFGLWDDFPRQIGTENAEGHIDVKYPAPAYGVDQESAERRAEKKANVKCRRRQTQSAAALLGRQIDRNDRPAVRRNHRAPDRLKGAKKNHLSGALR